MTVSWTEGDADLEGLFEDVTTSYRTGFAAEHAAPANYGTDPHWPPLTPMLEWTNRMGWSNPGLDESMTEDEMWREVERRKAAKEPLPSAFHLAAHMSRAGTEGLMYASDAFSQGATRGESWVEKQDYDPETPPDVIIREFLNWTFSLAQQYLNERVSSATTGELLRSGYPAVEDE